MAELEKIVAKIEADTSGLRRDLARIRRDFDNFSTDSRRKLDHVTGGLRGMTDGFRKLRAGVGSFLAVWATLRTGGAILDVVSQFEDLQDSLNVVFGGLQQGEVAMNRILDTASKTPFSIQTLTQAFITLQASGVEPTKELLLTFADAASVTTDRLGAFEAMVRVASRSVGGGLGLEELNQIADRGIPVWAILEEELGKNRLQLGEVGKTAEGAKRIMDALISGLNKRFGGATKNALDNISVATSNFKDALAATVVQLDKTTGAGDKWVGVLTSATENLLRWRMELAYIDKYGLQALINLRKETIGLLPGITATAESWEDYADKLEKATVGAGLLEPVNKKTTATVSELTEQINAARKELEFEIDQLTRSKDEQDLYNLAKEKGVEDVEKFVEAMRPWVANLNRAAEAEDLLKEAIEREDEANKKAKDTKDDLIQQYNALYEGSRTAKQEYDDTIFLIDQLEASMEALGLTTEKTMEAFERARKKAKEVFDEAEKDASGTGEVMKEMGATFESSFERAILKGEDLRSVLQGLADDLLQMATRRLVLGPLSDALFDSGGLFSQIIGSAKGNVFRGGNVVPFAKGGVVSRPTMFPMPRGVGLMGEAGEEAILPLKRSSSGHLGVISSPGKVEVNVYAPAGSSVETRRSRGPGGSERLDILLDEATAENVRRVGSETHRAVRDTFGLNQNVVPR